MHFVDSAATSRNSVPTIAALIDDADVLAEIAARAETRGKAAGFLTAQDDDPQLLSWQAEIGDRSLSKGIAARQREFALTCPAYPVAKPTTKLPS